MYVDIISYYIISYRSCATRHHTNAQRTGKARLVVGGVWGWGSFIQHNIVIIIIIIVITIIITIVIIIIHAYVRENYVYSI